MGFPSNNHSNEKHKFSILGLPQAAIAVIASLTWMGVSSGLIMLNKNLLSNGFPYPMALSGLGMAFSWVASYVTIHHLKLVELNRTVSWNFWLRKILPIGLLMALTLGTGNLVYLYLTVSFIQMLKSFTPIVTMIALVLAGLESPSQKLILSVCFIAFGTAITAVGELNFSAIGIVIMFLSESFEALRLVGTQLMLTGLKFHPVEGLLHLAPACLLWLSLGSFVFESRLMITENAIEVVASRPFLFVAAGSMGFAVNLLAYIVIQTASSLTLKVLGTVKNVLVVVLGIVVLGEKVTSIQGAGYLISIVAFYWYQKLKLQQIKEESNIPIVDSPTSSGDKKVISV